MRQAGLKPKSHSSGVYWTRAAAKNGKKKKKEKDYEPEQPETFYPDLTGDGQITLLDKILWFFMWAMVLGWFAFITWLDGWW